MFAIFFCRDPFENYLKHSISFSFRRFGLVMIAGFDPMTSGLTNIFEGPIFVQ